MRMLLKVLCATSICVTFSAQASLTITNRNNFFFETAQSLNGFFSQEYNYAIDQSTIVPHASVKSFFDNPSFYNYYKFTVISDNSTITIDVDDTLLGIQTALYLFDINGSMVANAIGHNIVDPGSTGLPRKPSSYDMDGNPIFYEGSIVYGYNQDAYIKYNFANAGDYVVSVAFDADALHGPYSGEWWSQYYSFQPDYTLHVSAVVAVPEPETYALLVVGLAGVAVSRRRKSA